MLIAGVYFVLTRKYAYTPNVIIGFAQNERGYIESLLEDMSLSVSLCRRVHPIAVS